MDDRSEALQVVVADGLAVATDGFGFRGERSDVVQTKRPRRSGQGMQLAGERAHSLSILDAGQRAGDGLDADWKREQEPHREGMNSLMNSGHPSVSLPSSHT